MVAVLVCDEYGVEVFGGAADAGEAAPNLPWAQAGIHEDARFAGFDVRAIAGGTAAENRQLNSHEPTLVRANGAINDFNCQPSGYPAVRIRLPRARLEFTSTS